jgi:hypothetical protein
MTERSDAVIHLRVNRHTVHAIDTLAVAWNVGRGEAANRLLDEGITAHLDEVLALLRSVGSRYDPTQRPPPSEDT